MPKEREMSIEEIFPGYEESCAQYKKELEQHPALKVVGLGRAYSGEELAITTQKELQQAKRMAGVSFKDHSSFDRINKALMLANTIIKDPLLQKKLLVFSHYSFNGLNYSPLAVEEFYKKYQEFKTTRDEERIIAIQKKITESHPI